MNKYHKDSMNWDTNSNYRHSLVWSVNVVGHLKDADGMANSIYHDQTAP